MWHKIPSNGFHQTTGMILRFDASRAAMMSEFGQTYRNNGDLEQASNDYSQSLRIYRRLAGKEANTIS